MKKKKNNSILRWLFFLPISWMIYCLIYLIVPPLICWVLDNDTFNLFNNLAFNISRIISSLFAGYMFVLVGYIIVPIYEKNVALGMLCLLLLKLIIFGYLCILSREYFKLFMNVFEFSSGFLAYRLIINKSL